MSLPDCIRITFTAENDLLRFHMQTGFLNHLFDRFPDFPAGCRTAFREEVYAAVWHEIRDMRIFHSCTSSHRIMLLYHSGFISAFLLSPKSEEVMLLRIMEHRNEDGHPEEESIFPENQVQTLDF
jgi:hypothetical protein